MSCVLSTHGDPATGVNLQVGTASISNSVLRSIEKSRKGIGHALSMTAEVISQRTHSDLLIVCARHASMGVPTTCVWDIFSYLLSCHLQTISDASLDHTPTEPDA